VRTTAVSRPHTLWFVLEQPKNCWHTQYGCAVEEILKENVCQAAGAYVCSQPCAHDRCQQAPHPVVYVKQSNN